MTHLPPSAPPPLIPHDPPQRSAIPILWTSRRRCKTRLGPHGDSTLASEAGFPRAFCPCLSSPGNAPLSQRPPGLCGWEEVFPTAPCPRGPVEVGAHLYLGSGRPGHCRVLSSVPGLHPLYARSSPNQSQPQMSPDMAQCLLGDRITPWVGKFHGPPQETASPDLSLLRC